MERLRNRVDSNLKTLEGRATSKLLIAALGTLLFLFMIYVRASITASSLSTVCQYRDAVLLQMVGLGFGSSLWRKNQVRGAQHG